ncbi:cyclic nucleotide-binding domain-containing protein [Variovorax sp. J22R133]|uniref:cyclic nucleotide-binding domain-containing protein n=1 Tax=Variovorax brevis TaxID=3053503 RepID=UPI002578F795|nr:cyclic nucleotide-binding domain-containing protein [Variovorax sp. J22R133]MDM0112813.1 cyclic nucleotide-binding domain-containing protein [Variovorax sp. J22R133]
MDQLLRRTEGLPELTLAAGETIVREGEKGDGLWILVSGRLAVSKAAVAIASISQPGAAIGEVSILLNSPYSATVVASESSIVRYAADGRSLLMSDPDVTRLIAVGLAERLALVTTYLADLKNQYSDSPGLAMVSDVLGQLTHHQRTPARAGSVREPNPDY